MTTDSHFSPAVDDPLNEDSPFDESDTFESTENNRANREAPPTGQQTPVATALYGNADVLAQQTADRQVNAATSPLGKTPSLGRHNKAVEPSLKDALTRTFEDMGPSREAEQRMLATLTTAHNARRHTGSAAPARKRGATATTPPRGTATQRVATPKIHPFWKWAVPVAACLVLVVGVGAWALENSRSLMMNKLAATSSQSAIIGSAEVNPSSPAPDANDGGYSTPNDEGAREQEEPTPNDPHASDGSSGSSSAGRNLVIELPQGQRLLYALDDTGAPRQADPALVGEVVASAFIDDASRDPARRTPCTVYSYHDATYPYAVCAKNSTVLYLAFEESS